MRATIGAAACLAAALCIGWPSRPAVAEPPSAPSVPDARLAEATHPIDVAAAHHSLTLNQTPLVALSNPLKGQAAPVLVRGQALALASDILFDFDSAALRPAASARLAQLVAPLPSGVSLAVTGFTDAIGEEAYNLTLSRRRSEAVAAMVRGARPDLRLTVTGRGEADPVAPNGTPEQDDPAGRAKNRRVELRYA